MTKDDDSEIFRKAMGDVKPMQPDNKVRHNPSKKRLRPEQSPGAQSPGTQSSSEQPSSIDDIFSDGHVEECPDKLVFSRSGVLPATLKNLRQGKLHVDNTIDLHGLTVDAARKYLLDFLGECESDGSRCIIIVHGKGYKSQNKKPVLKPLINRWLRQLDNVLAFHSAKPADGGTGAVYVLLRRIKD
jgi:DNA-nicking Smr family endonuclease